MEKIQNKNVSWIERVRNHESHTPGIMESQPASWQKIRDRLEEPVVAERTKYRFAKLAAACILTILLFQPIITDKHKGNVAMNKKVQLVDAVATRTTPAELPANHNLPPIVNGLAVRKNKLNTHTSTLFVETGNLKDTMTMKSTVNVIPVVNSISRTNQFHDTIVDNEPLTVWHENDLPGISPEANVTVKTIRVLKMLNNIVPDMTVEQTGTDKNSRSKNQLTNPNNQN